MGNTQNSTKNLRQNLTKSDTLLRSILIFHHKPSIFSLSSFTSITFHSPEISVIETQK